ncbi:MULTISPECIES: hypothetical protein [Marinomonas]|uniref:Uncharacterized protein n=1 Tax=Marinomonas rhodophyticola TaxID=2992803 RepID=A0ABT3KGG1_9GAMM|nr:hypothetical protein [Marinomonas sp. KJ51-3]MCW4629636.1 hypothetical protein [Marinomonas sp. KJ51-3]
MKSTLNLTQKINLFMLTALILMAPYSYADNLDSPNREHAAIYIMTLINAKNEDMLNQPFYVGQARQKGLTIDQMVWNRVSAHMGEQKFIDALKNSGAKSWQYYIQSSNDIDGWTALETDLNEQAYITNYCESKDLTHNPPLLNSRNEISQQKANNNWAASKSETKYLVDSAISGNGPKAVTNPLTCFTK